MKMFRNPRVAPRRETTPPRPGVWGGGQGTWFAASYAVRILAARFHFFPEDNDPIVVGHIVWPTDAPQGPPAIRPAFTAARRNWPVQIVADLKELVAATRPDTYAGLVALRGGSWSFVEVSPAGDHSALVRTINQVVRNDDSRDPVVIVR